MGRAGREAAACLGAGPVLGPGGPALSRWNLGVGMKEGHLREGEGTEKPLQQE